MVGVVIVLRRPQRVHFTKLKSNRFSFINNYCFCLTGVSCYGLQDVAVLLLTTVCNVIG